ncbi:MAG: precorrin-8X methylmutase, partial [Desulfovibrio sp.]|nr:precorrin-8X methylmutase [Desulfovibrio sp.]
MTHTRMPAASPSEICLDPAATPDAIEARSFALIDAEIPEPRPFNGDLWRVARRCVHTLGDVDIVADLRLNQDALEAGVSALLAGCTVFTDTRMAAAGLPARRLRPLGVAVTP